MRREYRETDKNILNIQEVEKQKLWSIFPEPTETMRTKIEPLIDRLAFLTSSMYKLELQMEKEGLVETYQNGKNQSGKKISATAQTYANFVKLYSNLYSKLLQLAPYDAGEKTIPYMATMRDNAEEPDEEESVVGSEFVVISTDPEVARRNHLMQYEADQRLMLDRDMITEEEYKRRIHNFEIELDRKSM